MIPNSAEPRCELQEIDFDPEAVVTTGRSALGVAVPYSRIVIDGVAIAFSDEGAGTPLVCLHAVGHGAGDFTQLRERLRSRFRVITLDWPSHGHSQNDHAGPSVYRYGWLLGEFLRQLNLRGAILIGNSIGGAAAIWVAAKYPDRVHSLVLENPGGLAPTGDWVASTALRAMESFFLAGSRGARWFPAAFRFYYRACVLQRRAARDQREKISAAGREMAPTLAQAWRSFGQPESDLRSLAPAIRCPTLFLWARGDLFVSVGRNRKAIADFPQGRLVKIWAGHSAHLETPAKFFALLESFLSVT